MNHLDSIPKPGRFPLIIDPLVGTTRLTKALMNGGSSLNLMYLDTFEGLGLTQDQLQSSPHPFYGVVLGKQSVPLRRVTLPVTFKDASNYRTETLVFEVVNFTRPYQVIMGQPCYVKFMVIPSYAYLKLKIPGPIGIITMEAKTHRALDCEQNSLELATTVVATAELREPSLQLLTMPFSSVMPPTSGTFKTDKDDKATQIDAGTQPKPCRLTPAWTPNRKASSLTSSNAIGTCSHIAQQKCRVSPGESPSTLSI
jgi:hypothetical protein